MQSYIFILIYLAIPVWHGFDISHNFIFGKPLILNIFFKSGCTGQISGMVRITKIRTSPVRSWAVHFFNLIKNQINSQVCVRLLGFLRTLTLIFISLDAKIASPFFLFWEQQNITNHSKRIVPCSRLPVLRFLENL